MSWSLGEVRALSTKAAKGAGFSWGEAEEAGFAVEWLEARCAPGVEALAHYLGNCDLPENCPIRRGCRILDLGEWKSLGKTKLCQPLLITPFIAGTLDREIITLKAENSLINISRMDVYVENYKPSAFGQAVDIHLTRSGKIPDNSTCKSRVSSDQVEFIRVLEKFAHNTYAPATEESRLAGAGAGTSDND